MNNRVFLTAIFIAVLATSATFVSPSTATPYSSQAATTSPQRENAPIVLTIPTNNVTYEVNGTFYAWVNVTSFKIVVSATGLPFSSLNITIPEFYIGIRISVGAKNIIFNLTNPNNPYVQGDVSVKASLTGRADVYINVNGSSASHYKDNFTKSYSNDWTGRRFIPWGTTKNFTMPFPVFDLDPSVPNATTADPVGIKFTNENLTGSDTSWTVTHNSWDFSTWLQNKVNSTLNGIAGNAMEQILAAGIPGISMGFTVPTSVGKVDLWKANATKGGTTIPNVLLMASALINLLVRYYLVGQGTFSGNIQGHQVAMNYNINVGADFGMFFSLIVASSLGHQVLDNYEINTFNIQVPENATLTWRKIGVIVYYGSPAHGCDITGGLAQGSASTGGGGTLFFVDYGWDGTPDFAANGTYGALTDDLPISHPTATVTGTTFPFTVQLDKSAGGWIYFSCRLPSGTLESDITVKRSDGKTVDPTQYWIQDKYLYVCDDPTYTYTVELVSGGGLGAGFTTMMLIGAAIAAVVIAAAVVVLRRRGAKPTNVSIK